MSEHNPLSGLLGQYGSDEDSEDETATSQSKSNNVSAPKSSAKSATTVHPPPVPHCPWSACYDNNSGYTYYWNNKTNEVTWEAPPDYLLALKLAQKKLQDTSSTEVTAEEWQLYQQALAEKQAAQSNIQQTNPVQVVQNKTAVNNSKKQPLTKQKILNKNAVNGKYAKKRPSSDSEDEKIEPITTYYRSDSESDTELKSPEKPVAPAPLKPKSAKKHKSKNSKPATVEYGPMLPPNQNYTVPIGPELPPEFQVETVKSPVISAVNSPKQEDTTTPTISDKDDEDMLLKELKDKAKLLENLGGEIPSEIQKYIKEDNNSRGQSPSCSAATTPKLDTNIDDLLDEIEKKELPKVKNKIDDKKSSKKNSPELGTKTPPLEPKPLFPSVNSEQMSLFPSASNMETIEEKNEPTNEFAPPPPETPTEKKTNIYLMDEPVENLNKKKLRISNSVLPERKKSDVPAYTTKYSQFIEGFAGERTGLGFSNNDHDSTPKKTISYGKGLMFTKGEVLHEDKSEEMNDDISLLDAKLKFLNQQQPFQMTPLQEMTVQMQTLQVAYENKALTSSYYRRWLDAAIETLNKLEQSATPQGWTCRFNRSDSRYEYIRDCDGFVQYEYPSGGDDMDICTTPPHPGIEEKVPSPPPPPPPASPPPPPSWDPPPPGCEPERRPAGPAVKTVLTEPKKPKKEITDELMSFYNDIAEIEKVCPPTPPTMSRSSTPDSKEMPDKMAESKMAEPRLATKRQGSEEKTIKEAKVKKKSKVKISASVGLKHKTVSSLVAKWQQVAEEINSD